MTREEIDKLYLDRLIKHQEKTKDKAFYAIQRIDILIISISGAGIYAIFEILKFLKSNKSNAEIDLIQVSGIALVSAILLNFHSQWSGYKANKLELQSCEIAIRIELGKEVDYKLGLKLKKNIRLNNNLTSFLNTISTICMVAGIISLLLFTLLMT